MLSRSYTRDACQATRGNPLALLSEPALPRNLNGRVLYGDPRSPEAWTRRRLFGAVSTGHWAMFCGRSSNIELAGLRCEQVTRHMTGHAATLVANGVDVARFVTGAIMTNGNIYYPTVHIPYFANVWSCLGWDAHARPALAEVAAMPKLDWQNRFRAACLLNLLDGEACDVALMHRIAGPELPAPHLDSAGVDRRCVGGLIGETSWACIRG
jgi:hypothetical protein